MRALIAKFAARYLDERQRKVLDKYFRRGRHSKSYPKDTTYYAWSGKVYVFA